MVSRDTSNPAQVKSEEDMETLRAAEEAETLNKVLGTYEGRRVIYNILARTGMYDDIMPADNAVTHRLLGRRSIGLETVDDILTAQPNVYILMQKEDADFKRKYQFTILDEED